MAVPARAAPHPFSTSTWMTRPRGSPSRSDIHRRSEEQPDDERIGEVEDDDTEDADGDVEPETGGRLSEPREQ